MSLAHTSPVESTIRPVRAGDASAIAEIHAELFEGAWSASALSTMITSPPALAFVAEDDGTVVGFIIANSVADETEILSIGVAKRVQRSGLATALLTTLMEAAHRREPGRIFLEVAEANAPARALYQRCGFGVVGRRRAYYARADGSQEDALVLARQTTHEGR
jgi:[ribosomal protein S18]-alanine N-acetyltransferase